MNSIVYKFFYITTVRFLLLNKLNLFNSFNNVPELQKLLLFFSITKIDDINHSQVYNYIYLFKFFFGRCAFISKIKSFFNLGVWTYSFRVGLMVSKKHVYSCLFFIVNDLLPCVDFLYLKNGIFSENLKIFYLIIKDVNIFTEKKTNLGLFSLEKNLNIHLYMEGVDLNSMHLFLCNLKLKLF